MPAAMNPVHEFLDERGAVVGCGTQLELDYWTREGTMIGYRLGRRIAWEHPRENEKRRKAWGLTTFHDELVKIAKSDREFSA